MKRRRAKNILIVVVVMAFVVYIELFVLTGIGTGFARACRSVEVGMSKEVALTRMEKYSNDNGVEFSASTISSTTEELSYVNVDEGYEGYYQCLIFIDKENRVSGVSDIFD